MRFSAPRSLSPSPVRGRRRNSCSFGLQDDSDEYDSYSESESETDSTEDTSSSSSAYSSDEDPPLALRPKHVIRDPTEQRQIEDTVAAIRLRTRHYDPYEEWEKQTRKDAFRTARKEQAMSQTRLHDEQDRIRAAEAKRIAAHHEQQLAEVQGKLNALRLQQQAAETKLREDMKARDKLLWQRVESVIKMEEDKVKARLEKEKKAREEEERLAKEAELKRRLEEEKKKEEEERKRKEAEEAQRLVDDKKKKEEEEERARITEEKEKTERLKAEQEQRNAMGMTTAEHDWNKARDNLVHLKGKAMKFVKSNPELKAEWGKGRRQITPKIGQLTNDEGAITRISNQLVEIIRPSNGPAHHPAVYAALLSSLAKAILLQAETEVTAEKRSAMPLAKVAFNLLDTLDHFPEIFFAKLVQRVGSWPIPAVVPAVDIDGKPWENRSKVMGYRKSENSDDLESPAEYGNRVSGIMRVYFHILKIPPRQQPLKPMFQLPRYWIWFARLIGERGLLETAIAPQLIYTALDVLGSDARDIWGYQWVKLLALVYEGVTASLEGGNFIGSESPEGKAARVRVQLEIERIMTGVRS
ncbi:uncharacterized protein LACBIDRAFT_318370 [Laccaria bicolor S238N-H82]|uniref:mRNA export factor GLE1 n=1 Tax=Laccaria bicolor (strain S238N-H82 / ATCC MYA-4686) TaxID=486041 RepID=B0D6L1_LACBS|nr:uncharacterized protein LACBIDRAFT_318370 [Laccaria bicolor S238N-H82]EDR10205.1 predicted protein [Laccaria bicolor S238N-H82]|eukprot:XP_001879590.1 predicted protein [Laccaria bicolor S238N-H82]